METPSNDLLKAKMNKILAFIECLDEDELLFLRFKVIEKLSHETTRVKKETTLVLKEPNKVANG